MSRAYRIRVREALSREQHASDKITSRLEMLDILPAEEMAQLLEAELAQAGFEKNNGQMERSREGVRIAVDPATGAVIVEAEQERKVDLEVSREGFSYDDVGPSNTTIQESLRRGAREELEKRAEQSQVELQAQATAKLEEALCEVSEELDRAVNRVTAEALKRKAATLGQIRDIHEDEQTGNLTITVEV
jgi:hypothetical protein